MVFGNGLLLRFLVLISLVIAALCTMPSGAPDVAEGGDRNKLQANSVPPKMRVRARLARARVSREQSEKEDAKVKGRVLSTKTTQVKAATSKGPVTSEPLAIGQVPRAKTTSFEKWWMDELSPKAKTLAPTRISPAQEATVLMDVNVADIAAPLHSLGNITDPWVLASNRRSSAQQTTAEDDEDADDDDDGATGSEMDTQTVHNAQRQIAQQAATLRRQVVLGPPQRTFSEVKTPAAATVMTYAELVSLVNVLAEQLTKAIGSPFSAEKVQKLKMYEQCFRLYEEEVFLRHEVMTAIPKQPLKSAGDKDEIEKKKQELKYEYEQVEKRAQEAFKKLKHEAWASVLAEKLAFAIRIPFSAEEIKNFKMFEECSHLYEREVFLRGKVMAATSKQPLKSDGDKDEIKKEKQELKKEHKKVKKKAQEAFKKLKQEAKQHHMYA